MKRFYLMICFLIFSASLARAEIIPGFGGNRTQPIAIRAEELAIDHKALQAVFSGDVKAEQSGFVISSRHMNVLYKAKPDLRIRFLYASGNVRLKGQSVGGQPAPVARGDFAEYNISTHVLILTGKIILERNGQIVTGQSLVIDLKNGQSRLDSLVKGRQGRVRGLFKKKSSPKPSQDKQPLQPSLQPPR